MKSQDFRLYMPTIRALNQVFSLVLYVMYNYHHQTYFSKFLFTPHAMGTKLKTPRSLYLKQYKKVGLPWWLRG